MNRTPLLVAAVFSAFVTLPAVPAGAEALPEWLTPPREDVYAFPVAGGGGGDLLGGKRLSVSLSVGLRPDMAQLGQTISKDGSVDTADTTMANLVYATPKLLMADRDNEAIAWNSERTNSDFMLLAKDPILGGALLGLEIGGDVQYDLDDIIGLPLFVKIGFLRTSSMSGGEQSRTLGTAATDIPTLAALIGGNGFNPEDFVGGTMKTTWTASWIEIPMSLGFRVKLSGNSTVYARLGLSYFSGGFSVRMDVDEKYANVLASHIDAETLALTNLSPGPVNQLVKFQMSSMGINYGLGAQTDLGMGLTWFLELNGSGAAKTVFSSDLSPEARQLMTATSSQTLAEEDPDWFRRLAFPVVTAGATFRTGIRYYIF